MNINKYKSLIIIVAFAVIIFSVISQVLFNPIVGLANNGDFQRYSLKIGLDYKEDPWFAENSKKYFWNYVIEDFKFVTPVETGFSSSHELTGKIAVLFNNIFSNDGDFNIKWMGIANAALYLLGIGLLFFNLRHERMSVVSFFCLAGVFFFTDKEIVQYFNSFYTEPASLVYLMLFFGLVFLYPSVIKSARRWESLILLIIEAFVIFMFLSAKLQNILGIIPILGIFGVQIFSLLKFWIKKTKFNVLLSVFLVVMLIIAPSVLGFMKNKESSNNAVSYNIIMMELLSLSAHPSEHLYNMGFNEEEINSLSKEIGHNAYDSIGENSFTKFASYFDRKAQIKIILHEPQIVSKLISKQSKYLFKPLAYGNFQETAEKGPLATSVKFTYVRAIKEAIYTNNFLFFASFLLTAFTISIVMIKRNYHNEAIWRNILFLTLPIFAILFFLTTVFGDSGHEIIKHFFLVNILFDATLVGTIYYLLNFMGKLVGKYRNKMAIQRMVN